MTRLLVVVEGQTEEAFVKSTLAPHLAGRGVHASATIVGTPKRRSSAPLVKGGGAFEYWQRDIKRALGGRQNDVRVTTLFDLYGLPRDFPEHEQRRVVPDTTRRCSELEEAIARRIHDVRFLPYIQRHEFEALVLASLDALPGMFDSRDDLAGLEKLTRDVGTTCPEEINDSSQTAPSKRLRRRVPGYRKLIHGPEAIRLNGLVRVRELCPRFDSWIRDLEGLVSPPS